MSERVICVLIALTGVAVQVISARVIAKKTAKDAAKDFIRRRK